MFVQYFKKLFLTLIWCFFSFASLFIFYMLFTDYNVIQSKPFIVKFIIYTSMFLPMSVNSLLIYDEGIYQRKSNSNMDTDSFTVCIIVFIVMSFVASILCSIPSSG